MLENVNYSVWRMPRQVNQRDGDIVDLFENQIGSKTVMRFF